MNLGLKMARLEKRHTQKELAKAVGVTPKYISLLEATGVLPRASLMKKIAAELGCPVQELFFNEKER